MRKITWLVLLPAIGGLGCAMQGGTAFESDASPTRDGGDDEWCCHDADADADGDIDEWMTPDGDDGGSLDGNTSEPPRPVLGVCLDGTDQTGDDALADCEIIDCLDRGVCCRTIDHSWIRGDLSVCPDPSDCGWTFFGGIDREAVRDGRLTLGSGSPGEAGMYTDLLVEPSPSLVITFRAALDPESCGENRCRQAVGLALSAQRTISAGTGVTPAIGLLLDGEQSAVHLYVNGRLERSVALSRDRLVRDSGYTMRIREDRTVEFELVSEDGGAGEITVTSAASISPQGELFRVVLFGRVDGPGSARAGSVGLERPVCDSPRGFRREDRPVLNPAGGHDRVGRPAVARRPESAGLLMVHESDSGLAVATSADGLAWERRGQVFASDPPATQYGRVARHAPALLYWGPEEGTAIYHLWFEGESESRGEALDGAPTFAIMHATSSDGLSWNMENGEDIAIRGTLEYPWRTEVGEPAVAVTPEGGLLMFFVGRDPTTGATRLGLASSNDGKSWVVGANPIDLGQRSPADHGRDGLSQPAAIVRGEVIHLWYTEHDGSRATIGYALGLPSNTHQLTWSRIGTVLEPSLDWEGQRVAGPAVVTLPPAFGDLPASDQVGVLTLWYEAGRPGRERLGAASRDIPARVVEVPGR